MTEEEKQLPGRKLSLAELEPLLRQTVASGQSFGIPVTGTSNLPTLSPERDHVLLGKADGPLKRGELPLYRRANGQYVLHRILSIQPDGSYTCCGDHQTTPEAGIRPDQIIAKVVWIKRKNREFSVESFGYRLWVRVWSFFFPCRRFLVLFYHGWLHIRKKLSSPK